MALSFGSSVPSIGTTGAGNGGLSYGSSVKPFSLDDWLFGADGLSTGVPIVGSSSEYIDAMAAAGVNTTQVDGTTRFTSALSGLTQTVLGAIGAQHDTATVTPASYGGGTVGGFDLRTVAIVGLIGAAIYYVATK